MATSYSDRVETAQWAIRAYEKIDGWTAPEDRDERYSDLAEALRAMIEPAPTFGTPAEVAAGIMATRHIKDYQSVSGSEVRQMLTEAVEAGIQAAWQSWEPDDYAPEPEEPVDLSQYSIPGFGNMQEALDGLTIRGGNK